MKQIKEKLPLPYAVMLGVDLVFIITAFIVDSPEAIYHGLREILTSRSILISDYLAIGGVGATLVNSAAVGLFAIMMLTSSRIKPSGAVIMALWLTAGFSFFGKNVFNMIPLTSGVWAYAKYKKAPFSDYALASLLVATLSPVVSEISFLGEYSSPLELGLGFLAGFGVGFIFPSISSHMVRAHGGYDLYSMGFTGGLIATIIATVAYSMGFVIEPEYRMSGGNNTVLSIVLYTIALGLVLCGLFTGGEKSKKENMRTNLSNFLKFHKHSGRLITDFFFLYKYSIYINMGLLCAFATTFVLVIGAELSGIVIAAILTMVGFACFGKHILNILPVMIGAFVSALLNQFDLLSPANVSAIIFSTALAPMAGRFGWRWGFVSGFLHVCVAMFVSQINGGLNLYNNGFAAGLVAMFLLPIINVPGRMLKEHED